MFESARRFREFYERISPELCDDDRREMGMHVWSYEKFAVDHEKLKVTLEKKEILKMFIEQLPIIIILTIPVFLAIWWGLSS